MFAAEPYTLNVDSLSEVPDLFRCVDRIIVVGMHYTSVIEKNINTTPRIHMLDHSLYISLFRDIGDLSLDLLGSWDELIKLG